MQIMNKILPFLSILCFVFGISWAAGNYCLVKAENFKLEGKLAKAKNFYSLGLKIYPWKEDAFRLLPSLYPGQKSAEAEKLVRKIIFFNQADPVVYEFFANFYLDNGQADKAISYFKTSLALNPLKNVDLYSKLEEAYDLVGVGDDKKKALFLFLVDRLDLQKDWYKQAPYEFQKKAGDFYYQLAQMGFASENYKQAFAYYLKARQAEKWTLSRFAPLPVLEKESQVVKNYAQAIYAVDPSFWGKHRPYYAKIFYFAGLGLFESDPEKTLDYWHKAAVTCPEWTAFALEYGYFYMYQGQYEEAIGVFENCLKLHFDEGGGCGVGLAKAKAGQGGEPPGYLEGYIANKVPDSF